MGNELEDKLEKTIRRKLGILSYDEYEIKLKEILDGKSKLSDKKSKIIELSNILKDLSKIYNFLNILGEDGSLVLCLALKNDPDNELELAAGMLGIRRKVQMDVIEILRRHIEELEDMFENKYKLLMESDFKEGE